ncbi:MAG TPA: winged helix-turn-helix domain-containing protein [Puia sp.]|nr:winged helix-turn-helix domain-containing protein [Puia sp.]
MDNSIAQIASVIGEPRRAKILWTLMDGRAYTARELAIGVETTPQNLSMHLSKMLRAGLLVVEAQGRHRYYSFSRPEVADVIEAIANLVPAESAVKEDADMVPIRFCRTCYDHLAGRVGVSVMESLLRQKLIASRDAELDVTHKGIQWFAERGIDCNEIRKQRRAFAKACLDWTERRHHLAGALGAALLEKMLEAHWLRRTAQSRAVVVTAKGRQMLEAHLNIQL